MLDHSCDELNTANLYMDHSSETNINQFKVLLIKFCLQPRLSYHGTI